MSIAVCLLMISSISAPITQNVEQSQNRVESGPSPTSGGSGGLADSPWPMFQQNNRHTGVSPFDASKNDAKEKWKFITGDYVASSPAIGPDGTIYIGSYDNNLYAINPYGTVKWSFLTGHDVVATPAIGADGTIYVGSRDNIFYAINSDGTVKWRIPTGDIIDSSAVIGPNGSIYFGSWDYKLHALTTNGSYRWTYNLGLGTVSSPAIGSDGMVYVGCADRNLYAIYPNGTKKWTFLTGGFVHSSPAIGSDNTIYVGSRDHNLYAINSDGTEKWRFETGDVIDGSPTIGEDNRIYIGSWDGKFYAINPDGSEKWNFTVGNKVSSSATIDSEGTIYIGSWFDYLYAIYPSGTEKWRFTKTHGMYSSPTINSDGTIYVGSWDYNLYAIGSTPNLNVEVTSHFTYLNSAAQSAISVHVTNGTNPVQGATVNLVSDNGGIFSPQSGITDVNGDFKSIFNAPTVTSQIICRISAEASKAGYNNGSDFVDVTINPIPWPMYRHNLNHTGMSPYDTSSNNGNLKWSYTTGADVKSSPVIGFNETIYVGSTDHKLYALNSDGTEKWIFPTENGIGGSPVIDSDGTIYVGSYDRKLYAINPDGTEKWNFTTGGGIDTSPIIGSDGTIYVGSYDNKLYAINPDGTEKWSFITGSDVRTSPTIGSDGTIYVGSLDNKLYAINPDGTEKWNFITGSYVEDSSPAIDPNGTIYFGSWDNKLYAINPDGTEKWSFITGDQVRSSPAIGSDGTIYVGSQDNNLYAINQDGTKKWSFMAGGTLFSSPAIGTDGTVYVGCRDNDLYSITPKGIEKWRFKTGYIISSSPAIGSDGTIYIGSRDDKLYAIGGFTPNIIVEKTANVTVAKPGDLIEYTIWYNNTIDNETDDYNGSNKQLTFEDARQKHPSFSPSGNKIIYKSDEDGEGYFDIWIMDADGTNHQQLTFENEGQVQPTFNPDGTKIAYESWEGGSTYTDIWIMDADGSNHQQLTSEEVYQRSPEFSPDGNIIAYTSQEDGGSNWDIWIMNTYGTIRQQITFENVDQYWPYFSPDGNKILYSSYEDGGGYTDIWIMDANGNNRNQLTFENYNQNRPIFNPDGSKIIYESLEDGGSYYDLWIMNLDGSEHKQLTFEDARQIEPEISPDGDMIVYTSSEDGGGYFDLWALNLAENVGIVKNVWINDTMPSEVTFITSSAESYRTGDYNWTFHNVEPGEHNFTITVEVKSSVLNGTILTNYVHLDYTDSLGNLMINSSDSVDVLVLAHENRPPIANVGPDQTVNEGGTVQFNGSFSYDPDGTIETYQWDFDSSDGLWWETVAVPDATGPTPNHTYGDDGVYMVTLRVIDNHNLSTTDTCNITVKNIAPYGKDLLWNGNFSRGTEGWNHSLYGYTTPSLIPPLPPSRYSISTVHGYLETEVQDGYNQMYQDVQVNTMDLDFQARFRAVDFSRDGGLVQVKIKMFSEKPPGWSGNPPDISNLSTIQSFTVGQISWYFRPDYVYPSNDVSYWELLGTGPSDWCVLNVNLHDIIVAHLPGIDESQVKWLRIWIGTYGESGGFTVGNFDDISLGKSLINGPNSAYEGEELIFTAQVVDPGSDDLIFTWNWGDGTSDTVTTHYNNGVGPEPVYNPSTNEIKSPWGTYPFSVTDTVIHTYGDDGIYNVTITIEDDDGGVSTHTMKVTVQNVDPTVTIESITMDVEIGLRVAGRKYNNVSMTLYEDGNQLGYVSIERMPGSPDEQMAWIPVSINFSKSYNATVTYIPEDPPNIGGNPVWIYLKSKDGNINRIHHTFNVQQSKNRDSEHWNHVEPWEVELNGHFIGLPFEITSHITDPGSDDENLTFTYGSQVKTVTYLNNPPNPDPYPSPEVNPVDIKDTTTLIYEGPGTVILVVKDDDNIRLGIGEGSYSISAG